MRLSKKRIWVESLSLALQGMQRLLIWGWGQTDSGHRGRGSWPLPHSVPNGRDPAARTLTRRAHRSPSLRDGATRTGLGERAGASRRTRTVLRSWWPSRAPDDLGHTLGSSSLLFQKEILEWVQEFARFTEANFVRNERKRNNKFAAMMNCNVGKLYSIQRCMKRDANLKREWIHFNTESKPASLTGDFWNLGALKRS